MVYLLLIGHEIKNDITELIKVFFPREDIIMIESIEEYIAEGILIINSLYENDRNIFTTTKLYINNSLVSQSTENINHIETYLYDKEKNIRIGIKNPYMTD